jgi:hypothetical protein
VVAAVDLGGAALVVLVIGSIPLVVWCLTCR